jgi:hypothetical protein
MGLPVDASETSGAELDRTWVGASAGEGPHRPSSMVSSKNQADSAPLT